MRWRRRATTSDPESLAAQLSTALRRVLAGDLAGAVVALDAAARLDVSSSDAYLALANVYRTRGDIGRAIQLHQNLLLRPELPPEIHAEALLGLALDFRAGGFLGRAEASFRELLETDPRNLPALRALEEICVEQGDWEQAIRLRRRIGSRDRATARVLAHLWAGLGHQSAGAGDEASARRAFRKALAQDRSCAEAHVALGDQQMRAGRPLKAAAHYRDALDLHPQAGRLILPRLLDAHRAADDLAGLSAFLHRRLERDPDDTQAETWLARVQLERGETDAAATRLESRVAREPSALGIRADLARAHLRAGREDAARKTFEELLEHLPSDEPLLRCSSCGAASPELHWRCPTCGAWDTLV